MTDRCRLGALVMKRFAAVVLTLSLLPSVASAQIPKVCGDVDESGTVTVSDGVQILRAAAGLSSDCTDAICDIDVNGVIGVTDGVVALRKAAGLAITQNCIPDDGTINQQVAHLVRQTQPLVSLALSAIIMRRSEVSDSSFPCDNDGTLDLTFSDGQLDAEFVDCLLDNTLISGTAEDAGDDPLLSLDLSDVRTDDAITFEANNDAALLGINTTAGVKLSGNLLATPSFELFDTGEFLLVVNSLEFSNTGTPLAGSITFELTEESAVPDVRRVRITYDGSNLARVTVTFTDGSFKDYKFELTFLNFV